MVWVTLTASCFRSTKIILWAWLALRHYEHSGLGTPWPFRSINLVHSAPADSLALRIQRFQKKRLRKCSTSISLDIDFGRNRIRSTWTSIETTSSDQVRQNLLIARNLQETNYEVLNAIFAHILSLPDLLHTQVRAFFYFYSWIQITRMISAKIGLYDTV